MCRMSLASKRKQIQKVLDGALYMYIMAFNILWLSDGDITHHALLYYSQRWIFTFLLFLALFLKKSDLLNFLLPAQNETQQ